MAVRRFCCWLALALGCMLLAQAQQTQTPGESTSRPQQPPTPPDATTPNEGTQTTPPAKSGVKRTLNKLDPHCIDVIFHSCWSSPAADSAKTIPDDEKRSLEDIDVGYYYLKDKNYRAAESRLKEALELEPGSPVALIGLAQAQQKLGKKDAARESYEAYLKGNPDGAEADKVKKALAQLK